jgi:hypothetical protein
MEMKHLEQILITDTPKDDSMDIPDCFGEYDKKSKLCATYCSISIKCCVMHNNNPKIDILEKLLIHNYYAVKTH